MSTNDYWPTGTITWDTSGTSTDWCDYYKAKIKHAGKLTYSGQTTTWTPSTATVTFGPYFNWAKSGCTAYSPAIGRHSGHAADDFDSGRIKKIRAGEQTIELPDGAILHVDADGNYHIDDDSAKVIYKANRVREFSPHVSASDMVAKFVTYVGGIGVRQKDVLNLPIHLFISWLIIEAAERDGDDIPADIIPVAADPALVAVRKPRCQFCKKFIRRLHHDNRFPFCSPDHATRHLQLAN